MSDDQLDPLRLVVQHLEEQLDERVDAVSDSGPSHEETTGELIHLEETLSSAQDKAKKLVTLRLKLKDEEEAAAGNSGAATPPSDASTPRTSPPGEPVTPTADS